MMKKELEDKLFAKYSKIFGQRNLPMQETCMCWGISCGDGWYNIIDRDSLIHSDHCGLTVILYKGAHW